MTNTPAEWTRPAAGGVPEYVPTVDETFGGVPELAPRTPREDVEQRGLDPAGRQRGSTDEALEDEEGK
ncbi:MAG: hypothetical protein WCF30_00640 [Terracidiphilus sp.]